MSVWKRKVYGKVRPIKKRIVKMPKPQTGKLRSLYSRMARAGQWELLDNVCAAMQLWSPFIAYMGENAAKMTVQQTKHLRDGLECRTRSYAEGTDEKKLKALLKAITLLEKASIGVLDVPKIEPYMAKAEKKNAAKNDADLQERYKRLLDALHALFPDSGLTFKVVPKVQDPVTGKMVEKRFDHSQFTIYFSREYAKMLLTMLRREGTMPLFVRESLAVSRALSFSKNHDGTFKPNYEAQVVVLHDLMTSFLRYAGGATKSRLMRKPRKGKKA